MINDLSKFKGEIFSVVDSCLLSCGINPQNAPNILDYPDDKRPKHFYAYFSQITNAIIQTKEIETTNLIKENWDEYYQDYMDINWYKTLIKKTNVIAFYKRLNLYDCYFNPPKGSDLPPYMNPQHPFYSKELNAAIDLWLRIHNDPDLLLDTTPSQALNTSLNYIIKDYSTRGIFYKKDLSIGSKAQKRILQLVHWIGKKSSNFTQQKINFIKAKINSLYPKIKYEDYILPKEELNHKKSSYKFEDDYDIPF